MDYMFKQRAKISHNTFWYLCEILNLYLKQHHTTMKDSIKDKVAMSLIQLECENSGWPFGSS
jgi:hypothetical protein